MEIEILCFQCPFCWRLYRRVREVLDEQEIRVKIQHKTDIRTVFRFLPRVPVMRVNGKIVYRGKRLPSKKKIFMMLRQAVKSMPKELQDDVIREEG